MATHRIAKAELSASLLKSLLTYDPIEGSFRWVNCSNRKIKPGSVAGKLDTRGYVRIKIFYRDFRAHQLAWIYSYGEWPQEPIDHIDGNPANNALANLRLGGNGVNQENIRCMQRHGSTGYLGVTKCPDSKSYRAAISVKGKSIKVGNFDTPEAAHQAYLIAKRQLHAGCTI